MAHRMAQLRRSAGLTQIEVSERLSKPKSWIAKLETGRRSLLFSEAVTLADLYQVNLADFDPTGRGPIDT
jgi:transcriptional regulator with XRE-family HTH domain